MHMKVALQLCDETASSDIWKYFHDQYSDETIVDQIIDMAPKIDEIMISCKFRNEYKDCHELFTMSITDEGLCYSFNALHNSEIVSDE